MTDKIDAGLQKALSDAIAAGIDADAEKVLKKKLDDVTYYFEEALMGDLKYNLAPMLAGYAAEMAQRAVEMLLDGNEDQMRRYLSCERRGDDGSYIGWNGRSDGYTGNRDIAGQHPIIHGKLFEQGCVALRMRIVEAHRDLLANERILDLEDQVRSLVAQNNKMESEKERMADRLRAVA